MMKSLFLVVLTIVFIGCGDSSNENIKNSNKSVTITGIADDK